jgi:hypothetical protein
MKPLAHARIAAYRYGGSWQEWLPYHDFFDSSKVALPSVQHRMFLHSDFGASLFKRIFGNTITVAGRTVPTDHLAQDHLDEDLGRVIPLTTWLASLPHDLERSRPPAHLRGWRSDPLGGMIERYGGTANDHQPLLTFFDEPRLVFAAGDRRGDIVLHNSFGIFLAERVLGPAVSIGGRLRATRSIAEDLVTARFGRIPTPATIAKPIRLTDWMLGADVCASLIARHHHLIDPTDPAF